MDIIIGAGVTGISYAGFTKNDYLLIEKETEAGGYCRTVKRNDFIWDYSGHFFHFRDSEIRNHVCHFMSNNSIVHDIEKHTQILYKDKYIDFPFQKNIHQLDKDEFIDCLYDLFIQEDTEKYGSFKEMLYGNYGKSIAEKFLIPYNEKLYACDLDTLDMNAMGRFFPKASKREIILNFKNNNNSSYNSKFSYPKEGAIEYINSLMKYVDLSKLSLAEHVLQIDINKKKVRTNKRELEYDNLISTIPFPSLLKACDLKYNSQDFSCNKVLVFNLGFNSKGNDHYNHWVYIPDKEISFYRVGYYDNILLSDKMSLYVEMGFHEKYELNEYSYYLKKVLQDLQRIGIISSQKLVDYKILLMNPAYVHITEKSKNTINSFKKKLKEYDIYSIGRYGSWTYCSIEDNIIEAKNLSVVI